LTTQLKSGWLSDGAPLCFSGVGEYCPAGELPSAAKVIPGNQIPPISFKGGFDFMEVKMRIRAEYQKILLSENNLITEIEFSDFDLLRDALNGSLNRIAQRLLNMGFDFDRETITKITNAMEKSAAVFEPLRNSLSYPLMMNFELTRKCPLNCPQCYCSLESGIDLDFERALEVLKDGAKNGLWEVNLSGGETMLYPRIFDLLEECTKLGVTSNIAVCGYQIDEAVLNRLILTGVSRIFVSLNGSSEEINSQTRNGYKYAVNALTLLQKSGFLQTSVNFVVHSSNCGDFQNMIALCEKYNVGELIVMAAKPTSKDELNTSPDSRQIYILSENIKKARQESKVFIGVENCYSQLRAYLGRSFFFGNTNTGIWRGCSAGRYMASLDACGNFSPCRHLPFNEKHQTIGDYWYNSPILTKIRNVETSAGKPCASCELQPYCLSCLAVNYKLYGELAGQNRNCGFLPIEKGSLQF
jgi:pyrroloquinoline quinone biosynthesis protein E